MTNKKLLTREQILNSPDEKSTGAERAALKANIEAASTIMKKAANLHFQGIGATIRNSCRQLDEMTTSFIGPMIKDGERADNLLQIVEGSRDKDFRVGYQSISEELAQHGPLTPQQIVSLIWRARGGKIENLLKEQIKQLQQEKAELALLADIGKKSREGPSMRVQAQLKPRVLAVAEALWKTGCKTQEEIYKHSDFEKYRSVAKKPTMKRWIGETDPRPKNQRRGAPRKK